MIVSHKQACVLLGCSAPTLRKYLSKVGYRPTTLAVETPRGTRYAQGVNGATLDQVRAMLRPAPPESPEGRVKELEARIAHLEAKLAQTGTQEAPEAPLVSMMELTHLVGGNPYRVRASMSYYGSRLAYSYREAYGSNPTKQGQTNLYPNEPRMLAIARDILV